MAKIATLEQTCGACPSQWEGALEDGRRIYIRFRWGHLSYGVGDTIDDAVRNYSSMPTIYNSGGEYDGVIGESEMLRHVIPHLLNQ